LESIKNKITEFWKKFNDSIDNSSFDKNVSSEKSVVFKFAWEFYKQFPKSIDHINFEKFLPSENSPRQFLDLYIEYKYKREKIRIGIEFKYPHKTKTSGSNSTQVKTKMIDDLNRLSKFVKKKEIDLGCFICLTNEKTYINYSYYNLIRSKKVKLLRKVTFQWNNIVEESKKNKIIENKKAYLTPIFIYN
jgi:hypothetical protein